MMDFIHQYWPHLTIGGTLVAIVGWLTKNKIFDILKWFFDKAMPDHFKALEVHEKHDDERFQDVKAYISDVKAEMIQAVSQNIGYLREDSKAERVSTEKRFEFLEKVYLDSRLDKR